MNQALNNSKLEMQKAVEHLKSDLSRLRVGRASPAMLDGVKVDAYGSTMTLKEVAALATPDAKTLTVQPWDMGLISEIEKGILASNLGLTPNNDGKLIRINIPPLTEERRKDFVKEIKKMGEDSKIAIRNVRRHQIDEFKKMKDQGKASEDDLRKFQDLIQKQTDLIIKDIDGLIETKSKEVMSL